MDRPDNVLTPEEIERTAAEVPYKRPGSRSEPMSPWASWASSVLGATILWQRQEAAEIKTAHRDDIAFAVDAYIDEVNYLVTLPDYSEEDKEQMRARQARLQAMTLTDPVAVLKAHIPSITQDMDDGELEPWTDLSPRDELGDYVGDKRVCHCGLVLDGYYEYVDHLKEMLA